jgi:RNA recognition motif-containing protein
LISLCSSHSYIAGLPARWSEAELNFHFLPFGSIISSLLLVDPATALSRCIGFVSYATSDEATAAIFATDGRRPEGESRPLQVKPVTHRTPSPRKVKGHSFHHLPCAPSTPTSVSLSHTSASMSPASSPSSPAQVSLYIAGLPTALRRSSLLALLCPYGALASLRILPQSPQRASVAAGNFHRGVAFARYQQMEDAERAIEALNGLGRWGGGTGLTVRWATHSKAKDTTGLTTSFSERDLATATAAWCYAESLLGDAFQVSGAELMMAAAMYQHLHAAMDFAALISPSSYGRYSAPFVVGPAYRYYAAPAMPLSPLSPSATPVPSPSVSLPPLAYLTLFLCLLPPTLTDGELFALFSPYGTVMQCRVVRERDGKSKGYGFMTYSSAEECRTAMRAMNGALVEGKTIKVQWKAEQLPQMGGVDLYNMQGWWSAGMGMGIGNGDQPVMA